MPLEQILRDYNEGHPNSQAQLRRPESGDLVIALSGELGMKASSDIAPLLDAALLECAPRGRIVLDLGSVGYISSTGVGLLATTMVKAEKIALTLVLRSIPPRVRSIMDTLGLTSYFNVDGSCD